MTLSPEILALAENLNMHLPFGQVEVRPDCVVCLNDDPDPHLNVVQRLRFAGADVGERIAAVRAFLRERGRCAVTWELGSSATPADLADQLMAHGMRLDEPESLATGMVLAQALELQPTLPARPVATPAEYAAGERIFNACFGGSVPDEDPAALQARFARYEAQHKTRRYLAFLDGRPVAAGDATFLAAGVVLNGSATLPEARGRGAYRALLDARFKDATTRGTPVAVVQAGRMSRPILARLGFVPVCEVRIFVDEFD